MSRAAARAAAACLVVVMIGGLRLFAPAPAAPAAAAAASPPALAVTAAALYAPATGQMLYGEHADRRVAIASTTKLMMTALVVLQHVKDLSTVYTYPDYHQAADDSQIGLQPGDRMTVHDLIIAMMLPSADDAAEDLADNVGHGSVARFVAMMNAEAKTLHLTGTHYTTPIGLDTPGNYSTASDLVHLADYDLTREPFFARVVAMKTAYLATGPVREVSNLNDLVHDYPWIDGVKTGHTSDAGYVLVASGHRDGMRLISAVMGTDSETARDTNSIALLDYGFGGFHLVTPVRAHEVLARPAVQDRPGLHVAVRAARGFERIVPRSAAVHVRVSVPRRLVGPLAAGTVVGTATVLAGTRRLTSIPVVLRHRLTAVSRLTLVVRFITQAWMLAILAVLAAALVGGLLLRVGRRPRGPGGSGGSGGRGRRGRARAPAPRPDPGQPSSRLELGDRMIITVTLNAAIDKTLEVPSFTPGRRHRTVDQTTMPGGKGVNIARAIKRLGQPVIATGFAGGATGSRIVEALNDESILNDFVRVGEESRTNTAVLDPTTGVHTEINERGPSVSPAEMELFREKLLYLAQGASICVFAAKSPARRRARRLLLAHPRRAAARGDDD